MPNLVINGLDQLLNNPQSIKQLGDNIGYLGHEASVTLELLPGYLALHQVLGKRLTRLFGPQHGFQTIDQDNMIETDHQTHPYLNIPVYSLYSETRQPTSSMLDEMDTLIIDLQDVGTRVYTYIWTMYLSLQACAVRGIRVILLDRPNPAGGIILEGNLPDPSWYSFVCMAQIPMRHGLTMAEIAQFLNVTLDRPADLMVIPMKGWKRDMMWKDTGLPWINPSPNLATPDSALIYPGSVLIEGTNLSEGRGTTRSLEQFGHPDLNPFDLLTLIEKQVDRSVTGDYRIRPITFKPTFDKHHGMSCGGFQIHVAQADSFRPWILMQQILKIIYHTGHINEFWNSEPYEYESGGLAIDYINGGPGIREWIEKDAPLRELIDIEQSGIHQFELDRQDFLRY